MPKPDKLSSIYKLVKEKLLFSLASKINQEKETQL